MSLGICCKKLHLSKIGTFAWYSIKIFVIFGVQFERQKVDKKKQTCTKTETCRLYSRVFWIFLPNVFIVDPCFKVGAFFVRHSVLYNDILVLSVSVRLSICVCVHYYLTLILWALSGALSSIWAVMIVWRIRVKIIRTVQCCIVYHNCTQL